MTNKQWLLLSSFLTLLFLFIFVVFTLFLIHRGVPLRFTNSISYDLKLNYLHNNETLLNNQVYIVGSSMALYNINGETLEMNLKKNITNLASWNMKPSEVFQQLSMLSLENVRYIVFATQFLDFSSKKTQKIIIEKDIRNYLNNIFSINPYIYTTQTVINNFFLYIHFEKEYMTFDNTYRYLKFDKTGGVSYGTDDFKISKKRWSHFEEDYCTISLEQINSLLSIADLARKKDIKLILLTTPLREEVLRLSIKHFECNKKYIELLNKYSNKYTYLNLSSNKVFNNSHFVDSTHLNKSGAILVSKQILKAF